MRNLRTWLNSLGTLGVVVMLCGCTTVYESPSGQKYIDASDKLVGQLAANLSATLKLKKPRVAVWSMTDADGKTSPMSITLHEAIKTSLSTSRHFELVEDEMMEKVQQSLRKQEKAEDMLKPESMIAFSTNTNKLHQLAELLAAQAIIVGLISESSSEYVVFIRLIPLTIGVAGSGARVTIPKRVVYHERPNPISNILNAIATSLAEPSNGGGGNVNNLPTAGNTSGGAGSTTVGGGGNYNYTFQGGTVVPQGFIKIDGYAPPPQAPGNNNGGGRNITTQGGYITSSPNTGNNNGGGRNITTQGGYTTSSPNTGNNDGGGRNVTSQQDGTRSNYGGGSASKRTVIQPTKKTVTYQPTTVPYYPTVIPVKTEPKTAPK